MQKVSLAHWEIKDNKELQVQPEMQDPSDNLGKLDQEDNRVKLVWQELQVREGLQDPRETQELQDRLDQQDLLVMQDLKDLRDNREQEEKEDLKE